MSKSPQTTTFKSIGSLAAKIVNAAGKKQGGK